MRILHVIESLEFGGAEKVVVGLANRMAKSDSVTVCLVKKRGELTADLLPEIDLICLDLGEGLHLGLPFKLAAIFRRRRIDVVNVHNWAIYPEAILAAMMARRARIVQTVHGPYTTYGEGRIQSLKRRLRHKLERQLSRSNRVEAIVTVSSAIREYIKTDIKIAEEKLLTIHNGLRPVEFEPIRYNGEVRLISVGRLAVVKNHRLLIDAFADAFQRNARLSLTIVGDGPLRDEIENQIVHTGLSDRVNLLGFRDDVVDLLASHDIFVLSSNFEGISIALLESMSMAKPAIATAVGGISETILADESGIIVPPENRRALSTAITRLADSPEMRFQMGLRARAHFRACFDEAIVIEKYFELYRRCMPLSKLD